MGKLVLIDVDTDAAIPYRTYVERYPD